MGEFDYIKLNVEAVRAEIFGRARLVAVSKSASDEELIALAGFGVTDIAENRPQELFRRYKLLSERGLKVNMHQIGTLQRNKVKTVVPFCSSIQSLDSEKLALEISRHAVNLGRSIDVLLEVNSAREPQKSGVLPEQVPSLLERIESLPNIKVKGLMTMGPVCENPEDLRPYFKETRELYESLLSHFGEGAILSMGMSDSYLVAIEEGANLVRVGRALFRKQFLETEIYKDV